MEDGKSVSSGVYALTNATVRYALEIAGKVRQAVRFGDRRVRDVPLGVASGPCWTTLRSPTG